jgi:hypothetical protein
MPRQGVEQEEDEDACNEYQDPEQEITEQPHRGIPI